ncbi:MAG: tetratricopeptide repeat protein [Planctomycetales bacterium]|nr:tetratricopeptide repeat protein [Planctomycetales bacterium]
MLDTRKPAEVIWRWHGGARYPLVSVFRSLAFLVVTMAPIGWLGGCHTNGREGDGQQTGGTSVNNSITASASGDEDNQQASITFSDHIAPIVHGQCSACHREGGVGPFALVSYQDVSARISQIVSVVGRGFMPPWLPEAQTFSFRDERRLTTAQREMFRVWMDQGCPRGDGEVAPPEFTSTWHLGEPDLELSISEPYELYAEGAEVYRNFVLPVPLDRGQYVSAYEFRPEPVSVVHHLAMQIDSTGQSRLLDAEDEASGFPGMEQGRLTFGGYAQDEGGQILGWTPGKVPSRRSDLAWLLRPGSDLVLQLHLQPNGKREQVRGKLALYFSDHPPPRPTYRLYLSVRDIDIPAGAADHRITLSYQVPVDVDVHNVYPHAHYICKQMTVTAAPPTGETLQLLSIRDWDFNWQDDYTFAEPVRLPAGTTIHMDYRYDNSAGNIRNPHVPPQRITYGERTVDEMGDIALLVSPAVASDLAQLQSHYFDAQMQRRLTMYMQRLEAAPNDFQLLESIGELHYLRHDYEQAVNFLQRAVELRAESTTAAIKLALSWRGMGDDESALQLLEKLGAATGDDPAVQLYLAQQLFRAQRLADARQAFTKVVTHTPTHFEATAGLARIAMAESQRGDALKWAKRAVELRPEMAAAWELLGAAQVQFGYFAAAEQALQRALTIDPKLAEPHVQWGNALLAQRKLLPAREHFLAATRLSEGDPIAWGRLGVVEAIQHNWPQAEDAFRHAIALAPEDGESWSNLGRAYTQQGRWKDALESYQRAVALPKVAAPTAQQYAWLLATVPDQAIRNPQLALKWAGYADRQTRGSSFLVLDTLAVAQAAAGDFELAVTTANQSKNLAQRAGNLEFVRQISRRIALFENHRPYLLGSPNAESP